MKNRVVQIVCTLLLGGVITIYAQESQPTTTMTAADTITWAKEKCAKENSIAEPIPRPNPAAREDLYAVLADSEQQAYWGSAVYAFRFLGQSEDVPRIVRWVEGFQGESLTLARTEMIRKAVGALGGMARRGVGGARPALEKMMSPDFWHGLSVSFGYRKGVGPTDRAPYGFALDATVSDAYTLDPDFKKNVGKIAEGIADPKEREAYTKKIKEVFDDYDAHMADGLYVGQRFEKQQAEVRALRNAAKKPEKPGVFAYNEAFYRWTVAKPTSEYEKRGRATLDAAVRERVVREAREAFEAIAKDLSDNKREAATARMCNGNIPCVLQDVDASDLATSLTQKAEWSVYLDLQKAVVKSLASCHLDESAAIVKLSTLDAEKKDKVDIEKAAAEPEKNVDLIFVQIPYSDADEVKAKDGLFLNPAPRFTEGGPGGAVSLCMMWQAGHWYWVPFGQ
jgi:hypothetical protein